MHTLSMHKKSLPNIRTKNL